ncbi:uncharacterized protein LOC107304550 isoform X2 [Oryza brachyantha]|uniref:uncharacterized protein LOC107304550 isoform X2 n=1 Tax=Oryza brachyantha TaxID=4533 RepID=UPI001ADBA202|nr:uncharacterized protein LOC107304550 isoform X2 [Oryza brachyantha]
MGKKKKPRRGRESSSSHESTGDEMSAEEATTPPRRSLHGRSTTEAKRNTRNKLELRCSQAEVIIRMLEQIKEDTSEMHKRSNKLIMKQLNKLTESHDELRKQLELHINGSSGDDSSICSQVLFLLP